MIQLNLRRRILPAALTVLATTGALLTGGATQAAAATSGRAVTAAKSAAAACRPTVFDWSNLTAPGTGVGDIAAVDHSGVLWIYPGIGKTYDSPTEPRPTTLFDPRFQAGTGWGNFTALTRNGDFNGDCRPDILARDSAGRLILYTGTGSTPNVVNGKGVPAGTGWAGFSAIVGAGDLTRDGKDDLLGLKPDGDLLMYTGTQDAAHPFAARGTLIGTGWKGDLLTAIGDWNEHNVTDLMFRDTAGNVKMYVNTTSTIHPYSGHGEVQVPAAQGRAITGMIGIGMLLQETPPDEESLPDALMQAGGTMNLYAWDVDPRLSLVGTGWSNYRIF